MCSDLLLHLTCNARRAAPAASRPSRGACTDASVAAHSPRCVHRVVPVMCAWGSYLMRRIRLPARVMLFLSCSVCHVPSIFLPCCNRTLAPVMQHLLRLVPRNSCEQQNFTRGEGRNEPIPSDSSWSCPCSHRRLPPAHPLPRRKEEGRKKTEKTCQSFLRR